MAACLEERFLVAVNKIENFLKRAEGLGYIVLAGEGEEREEIHLNQESKPLHASDNDSSSADKKEHSHVVTQPNSLSVSDPPLQSALLPFIAAYETDVSRITHPAHASAILFSPLPLSFSFPSHSLTH
jgi:hypothetical protein